ncbi:MAG: chlorophyll synthase ChlG [Devosiaceae bacterium]|nr:chlorophyll synthase ChlG [Devosiaceae bacterium MH13]
MKRVASSPALPQVAGAYPQPAAVVELLKPVTWFAAMWAMACGVVSSGVAFSENWPILVIGMVLAGPLVCGMSQAINDWFDRDVDAINEPNRPIPSGRIPGRWGLWIAIGWSGLSLAVASVLGPWVVAATVVGLFLAWAYSAPPFRLKTNGWWGNAAVGFSYEGLAWFTGAAAAAAAFPDVRIIALAVLYSIGAHGIMTLNDFKAIEGDQQLGIRSLPVQLGAAGAARVACLVMLLPQLVVVGLLFAWGQPIYGLAVAGLAAGQVALMAHFLLNTAKLMAAPYRNAALYNATGVTLYVSGMMVSAFALRSLIAGG